MMITGKFPELKELPTQELVDELTAERDALAVQVEKMSSAFKDLDGFVWKVFTSGCLNHATPSAIREDYMELSERFEDAYESTPTQYLAAHAAEVAAKAVEASADYAAGLISDKYGIATSGAALEILNHKTDVVLCVAAYAEVIRQQAKDKK